MLLGYLRAFLPHLLRHFLLFGVVLLPMRSILDIAILNWGARIFPDHTSPKAGANFFFEELDDDEGSDFDPRDDFEEFLDVCEDGRAARKRFERYKRTRRRRSTEFRIWLANVRERARLPLARSPLMRASADGRGFPAGVPAAPAFPSRKIPKLVLGERGNATEKRDLGAILQRILLCASSEPRRAAPRRVASRSPAARLPSATPSY